MSSCVHSEVQSRAKNLESPRGNPAFCASRSSMPSSLTFRINSKMAFESGSFGTEISADREFNHKFTPEQRAAIMAEVAANFGAA